MSGAERNNQRNPLPDHLAKYPTPFHVYHEAEALADAKALKKGLKSGLNGLELYYSVKTNPLLPLLRCLLKEGWGMEVVGSENLQAAIEAECPGKLMLFNGAAWNEAELSRAIFELGIENFTIDSQPMAEQLARVLKESKRKPKLNIALRLHDGRSHFGFHPQYLKNALQVLPKENIASLGLQLHANPHGSAYSTQDIAHDFLERCARIKAALLEGDFEFLDLGGGIDSPYVYRPHPHELGAFHNPDAVEKFRAEIPKHRFTLEEAGATIAKVVVDTLGKSWSKKRVLFEPGRSVCTRALSTVIGVKAIKEDHYPDAKVVITDGDTAFLGPLHRGVHSIEPMGDVKSFVYGRLPHSGDWLFQNVKLPKVKAGDRLTISNTGAYFLPLEAAFGHGRALIVRADRDERIR